MVIFTASPSAWVSSAICMSFALPFHFFVQLCLFWFFFFFFIPSPQPFAKSVGLLILCACIKLNRDTFSTCNFRTMCTGVDLEHELFVFVRIRPFFSRIRTNSSISFFHKQLEPNTDTSELRIPFTRFAAIYAVLQHLSSNIIRIKVRCILCVGFLWSGFARTLEFWYRFRFLNKSKSNTNELKHKLFFSNNSKRTRKVKWKHSRSRTVWVQFVNNSDLYPCAYSLDAWYCY